MFLSVQVVVTGDPVPIVIFFIAMALYVSWRFLFPVNSGIQNETAGEVQKRSADIGAVNGHAAPVRGRDSSRCPSRRARVQGSGIHRRVPHSDRRRGFRPPPEKFASGPGTSSDDRNWVLNQFYSTIGAEESHNLSCYSAK